MRTAIVVMSGALLGAACASAPTGGALGEGSVVAPRITAVDSAFPPRHVTIQVDQPGYVALLLVAPGHSATLLHPPDSLTSNRVEAGTHQIAFQIPGLLVLSDSMRLQNRARGRDSSRLGVRRSTRAGSVAPIPPEIVPYLLLFTSPQPLVYQRIVEKTAGVSIPNIDMEALNAVGKAIKATLANEPREWAGYYHPIELRQNR